jgi:hypothetical protein
VRGGKDGAAVAGRDEGVGAALFDLSRPDDDRRLLLPAHRLRRMFVHADLVRRVDDGEVDPGDVEPGDLRLDNVRRPDKREPDAKLLGSGDGTWNDHPGPVVPTDRIDRDPHPGARLRLVTSRRGSDRLAPAPGLPGEPGGGPIATRIAP